MAFVAVVGCLAACAHAPPPPHASPDPSTGAALPDVAEARIERLQHRGCVGEKRADNVAAAKDGTCLCYEPPWEGGVPPPDEDERRDRHDFDGIFLCRPNAGTGASTAVDDRHCPVGQPVAGDACSAHDAMLRNGDCLYVAPDMKTPIHARCESDRWREVPEAEIERERMMRQ